MSNVKKIISEIVRFSELEVEQNLNLNYHQLYGEEIVEILKHCFEKKYFIRLDLDNNKLISTIKIFFQNKQYFHVNHVNLFVYGSYNEKDDYKKIVKRLEENLVILKNLEFDFNNFYEKNEIEYKKLFLFLEEKSKNPDLEIEFPEKEIKY